MRRRGTKTVGKLRWLILIAVTLAALLESTPATAQDPAESEAQQMTLVTDRGEPLLVTGLPLKVGTRFIDGENTLWHVVRLEGARAVARSVQRLARKLSAEELALLPPVRRSAVAAAAGASPRPDQADVLIYHSHSDESYEPTQGTGSVEGKGGIYDVGASLSDALGEVGLVAVQSQANHNPRDHRAYVRSRRTAMDGLMELQPVAMFDVHRDTGPAREYLTRIGGEEVARVLIVIGGANPAHEANLAFARLVKDRADSLFPGLVRGILVGQGNYNQDLYSRNILLEAGSYKVSMEAAQRGISLLAQAIVPVLTEAGAGEAARAENLAAMRTIVWIVTVLVVLGGGGFVLMSGGWRPALVKLANARQELWERRRRR